jgi:hypothetical protein
MLRMVSMNTVLKLAELSKGPVATNVFSNAVVGHYFHGTSLGFKARAVELGSSTSLALLFDFLTD